MYLRALSRNKTEAALTVVQSKLPFGKDIVLPTPLFYFGFLSHANCGWAVRFSSQNLWFPENRVMLWSAAQLSWDLTFSSLLRVLNTGVWNHTGGMKSHISVFSLGHSSLQQPQNAACGSLLANHGTNAIRDGLLVCRLYSHLSFKLRGQEP